MNLSPVQRDRLRTHAAAAGVTLDEAALDKFDLLARLLLETNEKFNLTAIRSADGVVDKHFIDSLWGHRHLPARGFVLDIGTGAGFPGMPLKIAAPERRLLLIDGTGKKIGFVQTAIQALGLQGISGMHQRAEDQAFQFGLAGQLDAVTARAVAATDELAKLAKPFLKKGGRLVLYKGLEEAEQVRGKRFPGFGAAEVVLYKLPEGDPRALVLLRKQ